MQTTNSSSFNCKIKAAIFFIVGFVVFSCNEEDYLTLSVNELNVSVEGIETTFRVNSNTNWNINVSDSWVHVDLISGTGELDVTVSIDPNLLENERETTLVVSSGGLVEMISVTQSTLTFSLNRDEINFDALGTPQQVNVTTNAAWTLSFSDASTWCTADILSGDGNGVVTLTPTPNPELIARQGSIVFSALNKELNIYISQEPQPYQDGEVITYQTYSALDVIRGVNLVVVGDGFLEEDYMENGTFDTAAEKAIEAFFRVEPFPTYRDYFTVYKVVAYSEERGATVQNDFINSTQRRQTRNTVFSSVLEGANSTGIDCDENAVFEYALKIPKITENELPNTTIIVIINLDVYAGTTYMYSDGKSIALCPMGEDSFEEIVYHEAGGHGFGRLYDEYIYYANQSFPNSSILELEWFRQGNVWSFGANMSVTDDRESVHWNHYYDKEGYEMVDLYEGGGLYGLGVWRPEINSCMNDNVPYFNAPSREAIVRRIMAINNKTFDYDTFYGRDKIVPATQAVRSWAGKATNWIPLAPPVLKR